MRTYPNIPAARSGSIPDIRTVWLLLACALLFLSGCTKTKVKSSDPTPAASMKPESPTFAHETITLGNGLKVILHKDSRTTFATVNLSMLAGSGKELPGEEGAAYLLQYLLFQAGSGLSDNVLQLFEAAGADTEGGGVSSSVDYDRTTLTSTVPANAVPWVLWLESKRLHGFLDDLSSDVFLKQRSHVQEALIQAKNKPFGMQNDIISRNLYPKNHPYSRPITASPAEVARLTAEKIKAFYARNFSPQNAVLVVSGNIDVAATAAVIKSYFGSIRPAAASTQVVSDHSGNEPKIKIVHRSNAPTKILLVWRGPDIFSPDLTALEMATGILNGGKTAKLHQHLVLEQKLATRVTAAITASRLSSEYAIEIYPVKDADADLAVKAVQEVLREFSAAGPGETDVAAAKAKTEFEFFANLESSSGPKGRAALFSRFVLFGQNADQFTSEHERIIAQSPETLKNAVKKWLGKDPALEVRFIPTEYGITSGTQSGTISAPKLAKKMPLVLPEFSRKVLPNGLDLIVFHRENARNVELDLVIKTAELFETEDRSGVSMLTAKSLLAGTKSRSSFQIENAVNSFGGSLVSDGSKFGARLTINGLKRHLEGIFELLADVVVNPVFPDSEITTVKKIVTEKLKRDQTFPQHVANAMFSKILFAGGHPGGLPTDGNPKTIEKITTDQIKEHHQKYWLPNNAALIVSGAVTMEEAEKLVTKHFAFWSQKKLEAVTLQELPGPDRTYAFLVNAPEFAETIIRLGSVAPYRGQADDYGLQLLNKILINRNKSSGSLQNSALLMNRYFGYWMQSATSDSNEAVTRMINMRAELENLASVGTDIMHEELQKAQSDLTRNFLRSFDSSAATNNVTASFISNGIAPDVMNNYLPELYQYTTDSVKQLAARYYSSNRQIVLFIGDLTGIEQELLRRKFTDVVVLDREGKFLRKSGS